MYGKRGLHTFNFFTPRRNFAFESSDITFLILIFSFVCCRWCLQLQENTFIVREQILRIVFQFRTLQVVPFHSMSLMYFL